MSELKPEMFDGIRSYKAFLYAIKVFEKLEKLQKEGYIFFYGESSVDDYFFVDKKSLEAGTRKNNCSCPVIGCTFGGDDYDKPYITKSEINDYVKQLRFVHPNNINKFKLEQETSK